MMIHHERFAGLAVFFRFPNSGIVPDQRLGGALPFFSRFV
jgi:hypothetical protein